MQLRVFLLIGFVLNAFCLNNLNGGFLSPKYDLRKNESLVESLKKDPSSFAELFTKADPQKTDEIIDLLEALVAEASAALDLLRSHVTDATNSLNTANSNVLIANNIVQICEDDVQTANESLEAAQVALDLADTDHLNAVIDQTNAVNDQQEAQSQKDFAEQNYAEESPPLIDEQEVLQQVIDIMGGLKELKRYAHSQCMTGTTPYSGDRTDNPVFGGGGFIGSYTGPQCQALCNDVNNVDSHGRTCVAFEHSSHNYLDQASCALAWACDSTSEWSGGTTYIRKKACTIEDTSECVQGDVALYQQEPQQVNGSISGLLLIWYNNAWGTVCDDVTDCDDPNGGGLSNCGNGNVNKAGGVNLAQVVCRALGFLGGREFNADGTTSGYPIVVDGTENHITGCAGDENRLSDCQWIAFGSHNCVHSEDVGVQCEG